MYAIIELNGDQVKCEKNDVFTVNHIKGQKSKTLKVKEVLFGKKGNKHYIGEPYVKGAYVECDILREKRDKKSHRVQIQGQEKFTVKDRAQAGFDGALC